MKPKDPRNKTQQSTIKNNGKQNSDPNNNIVLTLTKLSF